MSATTTAQSPAGGTRPSALRAPGAGRVIDSRRHPPPTRRQSVSAPSRDAVSALMPQLKQDLARLVAIPSISKLGLPRGDATGAPRDARRDRRAASRARRPARHARASGHRAGHPRRDPGARRSADRPSLRALRRRAGRRRVEVGVARRSRRPSETERSTGAARPTRSRTSSMHVGALRRGRASRRWGSRS